MFVEPLRPGDKRELVRLDLEFHDETFMVSDPVPRTIAEEALHLFARGDTRVYGRRVTRALIIPLVP